jgi:glycogen operon protein
MEIWPGKPFPFGASFDGVGTNFSVFSEAADRVELCLYDDDGGAVNVDLPEMTGFCWHGYVPTAKVGQRYGFRVHGAWNPAEGKRCNPAKLLVDPYAKAVEGMVAWSPAVFAHRLDAPDERSDEDSAPFVPRSVVASQYFDWRMTGRCTRRGTRRSSTSCTSRASRLATRTSPSRSAARTPGWPIRPPSIISGSWASRRWS